MSVVSSDDFGDVLAGLDAEVFEAAEDGAVDVLRERQHHPPPLDLVSTRRRGMAG